MPTLRRQINTRFPPPATTYKAIGRTLAPLDAGTLRNSHAEMETGRATEKTVITW